MAPDQPRPTRAEQRRQTEARILNAARDLFARSGYDRTTIRAVAAAADTDPGLVMRYFGSKEELFSRVAEISADEPMSGGTPGEIAELLLASLGHKLQGDLSGTLAMLRSMLTHPEAGKEVHVAITDQQRQVAAAIPTEDAVLRAGLIGAITLGIVIGRDLLHLEGVRDAKAEDILAVLRPAVHGITQGATEPAPRSVT
ncbi:TetR/AcrR family transcriptional regulator [Nonomuraea sp. CA-143628]|uniref:TetR/AcrR family transcriptional regulator n=1 Tax=Nonomuraea sp. CA-143628 TaxID=3239997 RepID=UPI003D8E5364